MDAHNQRSSYTADDFDLYLRCGRNDECEGVVHWAHYMRHIWSESGCTISVHALDWFSCWSYSFCLLRWLGCAEPKHVSRYTIRTSSFNFIHIRKNVLIYFQNLSQNSLVINSLNVPYLSLNRFSTKKNSIIEIVS